MSPKSNRHWSQLPSPYGSYSSRRYPPQPEPEPGLEPEAPAAPPRPQPQIALADVSPPNPAQMLTYAEACTLLRVDKRTIRRRVAAGRYLAYGEGSGKRIVYRSILADIQRECGEVD